MSRRTIYTPDDWQDQFNLYSGSGLGLSHKMMQIGGFRPKNFDEVFKNVFYVGASTIPGTGLPMVIISSKLAAERVEKYQCKENRVMYLYPDEAQYFLVPERFKA